jgi:SNF2 family DNA or RNA helicase
MDRIHRLGQRRPVQAIKLVIEDSIESRIVQLQEKKSAMVDATLSTDDSVRVTRGAPSGITNGHVTVGDGPTHS